VKAAFIAVGSELLGTERLDTNSLHVARILDKHGVALVRKSVVGDVRSDIADEVRSAVEKNDLVIVSGGLGPTEDDLTRDALATAFELQLRHDESTLRDIREKFESRAMPMPEVNARQAMVFEGHRTLPNRRGTAPGFHISLARDGGEKHLWVFPGVPSELEGMVELDFEPWLSRVHPGGGRHRRVLRVAGMSESAVEEKIAPFYEANPTCAPTILSTAGEIQIHLVAQGSAEESWTQLDSWEGSLRGLLGERCYGVDGETLESVVGRMLASRGQTVATAESCTGGLIASRITDVSGSSGYFLGGVVAYSRDAKLFLLGVDPAVIDEHGEVSEEVSRQMAVGARRRFSTTWGVAVTGIAGPTGGTEDKPLGTVHLAVAGRDEVVHRRFLLPGSRERIKALTAQIALDLLRIRITRSG